MTFYFSPKYKEYLTAYPVLLNNEEENEVKNYWDIIKSAEEGTLCIKQEFKETFERNIAAQGLWLFSEQLINLWRVSDDKQRKQDLFEKALNAVSKAFRITMLPIYLYDFACLLDENDESEDAIILFRSFLDMLSSFQPNPIEKTILNQRNVQEAIGNANDKLKK